MSLAHSPITTAVLLVLLMILAWIGTTWIALTNGTHPPQTTNEISIKTHKKTNQIRRDANLDGWYFEDAAHSGQNVVLYVMGTGVYPQAVDFTEGYYQEDGQTRVWEPIVASALPSFTEGDNSVYLPPGRDDLGLGTLLARDVDAFVFPPPSPPNEDLTNRISIHSVGHLVASSALPHRVRLCLSK